MPHPNIERIRRLFEAFNAGDLEAATRVMAPDLVYRIAGRSPLAGEHHGADGFFKVMETAKSLTGGTIRSDPLAVLAGDEHVMVWTRVTAERNGRRFDGWNAYVYRFEDGKVVEGRTIPADLYAFDAFWED